MWSREIVDEYMQCEFGWSKRRERAILSWALYHVKLLDISDGKENPNARINGENAINGENNDSNFWWSGVLEIDVFSSKLHLIHPQHARIPMCKPTISPTFIPTGLPHCHHTHLSSFIPTQPKSHTYPTCPSLIPPFTPHAHLPNFSHGYATHMYGPFGAQMANFYLFPILASLILGCPPTLWWEF